MIKKEYMKPAMEINAMTTHYILATSVRATGLDNDALEWGAEGDSWTEAY